MTGSAFPYNNINNFGFPKHYCPYDVPKVSWFYWNDKDYQNNDGIGWIRPAEPIVSVECMTGKVPSINDVANLEGGAN